MIAATIFKHLTPQEKFKPLGKFTLDRHISGREGGGGVVLSYTSYIGRCHPKDRYDFDHYNLKSGMVFKGTTRAYKRTKNGMFWSEIAPRFKKLNVPPPPSTIPRAIPSPLPAPAYRVDPSYISFATHARINEIKMQKKKTT